ncbi:hypothetical protein GBP346_B1595 [Burkholderia pseudomallei MSHR346]|nr:hypothetical protein BUC_6435 [Burkholderia pseudomallei 576]EEP51868.1 hypothetical protein GBP346_B1595 [Burkholderia pseudomallei MSHR346]
MRGKYTPNSLTKASWHAKFNRPFNFPLAAREMRRPLHSLESPPR